MAFWQPSRLCLSGSRVIEGAETDLLIDESTYIKLVLAAEILPENADASIQTPQLDEFDGQLKLSSGNLLLTYNHFAENYD